MTATAVLITPDPDADEARRRGLRRMRTVAVSLLGFAAVVYVATLGQDGLLGFVNAGAEASMVGAIADWFAVTALFKHPLGLPIPHTALIPRRKDELGKGLEEFVGENFLQEGIIRDRIAAATISKRVARWLSEPANARRVVDEIADVAVIGLGKVRDDHVADLVTEVLVPRFREEPISPLLGGLLSETVRDDLHHGLVDLALAELHEWLEENPDTVLEILGERAPWWAPPRLNDAVMSRVHVELVRWVADIRAEPRHHARQALDPIPRPGPRRSRSACSSTRRCSPPASRSGTPCAGSCSGRWPTPRGQSGCACSPRSPASPSGWTPTSSSATAWTASPRTSRCSRSTVTATS
jgi:uncharacterized membrane-anchored protein YjiN (DUF445 family)